MKTHSLSKLEIPGRDKVLAQEPRFDFYRIEKVRAASIDFEDDVPATTLVLMMEYRGESTTYNLTIRFEGIRELVLPEMRPQLQLNEVEVEDVRERMLEGIRFEVISHFDRSFRCSCKKIVIVDFEPIL